MKAKNLFLCLLMGAMAVFSVSCDDDMAESDVPEVVMAKFQQMYPNVTATWEKETNGQIKGEFY
ncbi:MAG: hypothetical protein IJT19_07920, partial [Bacteroidaceae bacterium]|nr:hypothetical protein [Bacteroidaceae bacterium]